DLFDRKHRIACGIHPCGYGVDEKFDHLARYASLDPAAYVLHVPPRLVARVEGGYAKTTVFMVDKPRLIADLLDGSRVLYDGWEGDVGAGCLAGLRVAARELARAGFDGVAVDYVICACGALLRLSGPDFGGIVWGNVWAVGEAAGLVGPASGAGNVYAMQSG